MKYFIKIFILSILVITCNENPTEPKDEEKYWSVPTDEAIMLYFREFDSIRLDSMIAGKIQYRLDIAKSVVEDTTIKVHKDWRFGELLLGTNDVLYNAFDTTTFRFNSPSMDSLLSIYELNSGYKFDSFIELIFPEYYNMVTLSQIFDKVDGVIWSEENIIGGSLLCSRRDIKLRFKAEIYKFIFSSCDQHIWIVEVVDDSIIDITEWDLIRR